MSKKKPAKVEINIDDISGSGTTNVAGGNIEQHFTRTLQAAVHPLAYIREAFRGSLLERRYWKSVQ
jgi:hypothetical protein